MTYDAIIFDIDGTLWDATEILAVSWNKGAESLGEPKRVTRDDMKSVMGLPFEQCVEKIFPGSDSSVEEIMNVIVKASEDGFYAQGGEYYPGVKEGIPKLAEKYPIFLVSNCGLRYMETFLKFSGFAPAIKGYDCHGMSHLPKADMMKNIISKFSLKNPVCIGDTSTDSIGAVSAGIDFFHAAYGFGKVDNCKKSFYSFLDIVTYLNEKV